MIRPNGRLRFDYNLINGNELEALCLSMIHLPFTYMRRIDCRFPGACHYTNIGAIARRWPLFVMILAVCLLTSGVWAAESGAVPSPDRSASSMVWTSLPDLPDTMGFGGSYAGVADGVLIVAGGANFPDGPPWEGGQKVWYSDIFVFEPGSDSWQVGQKLNRAIAYGASVSTEEGLILIGGCDSERAYADVIVLRWDSAKREISQTPLPALPRPSAFHAATKLGSTVYVLAGQQSNDPTDTIGEFWALDLSRPSNEREWSVLPPLPGTPRVKAVMAGQTYGSGHAVFVFSGEVPTAGAEPGQVDREYPADAWRFDPDAVCESKAWTRIADPPLPVAAGAAIDVGQTHVIVFSGSTGRHISKPVQDRPTFPRNVLEYQPTTDTWATLGQMPVAVVTTSVTRWNGKIVIASGEVRPGVRTNRIQAAEVGFTGVGFGVVDYSVLVVYLLVLVGMGFYFASRERSTDDFFLAGRRVPWWAAGLSIFATMLSAITYLAIPARTFATDWVYFPLNVGILLVAPIVAYVYLPFFRRLNITSAYEYLELRFGLSLRLFGSVSFIGYQLGRMGIVVLLPALALSAVTGLDIYLCIILMGSLATVYTALGGIEAVIWTDVAQTIVLIGGAIAALFIVAGDLPGGFGQIISDGTSQEKFTWCHLGWDFGADVFPVIAISLIFVNIVPYTSDQAIIQRYLTTPTEKQAARAIWTNGLLCIPASILFFGVGTALFAYFKAFPLSLAPLDKPDQVFPWFIAQRMPVGLAGLVIAGVFAAAMSSLDSGMHSISTVVTTDFLRRFRSELSEHSFLVFARWLTVVLGVLGTGTALLMASFDIKFLWDLFLGIVGLLLGTVGGTFTLGIFTRRATGLHAWIGVVASVTALVYTKAATDLNGLLYAPIGMITCVGVGYLFSLIIPTAQGAHDGLTIHSVNRRVAPAVTSDRV